jgi:hypothetical protein
MLESCNERGKRGSDRYPLQHEIRVLHSRKHSTHILFEFLESLWREGIGFGDDRYQIHLSAELFHELGVERC